MSKKNNQKKPFHRKQVQKPKSLKKNGEHKLHES